MLNEILKGLGRMLGQVVLDEIATGGQVADPKTRKIRPRYPEKVRRRKEARHARVNKQGAPSSGGAASSPRPSRARAEAEVVDVEAELVCPFCFEAMAEHRGSTCPK